MNRSNFSGSKPRDKWSNHELPEARRKAGRKPSFGKDVTIERTFVVESNDKFEKLYEVSVNGKVTGYVVDTITGGEVTKRALGKFASRELAKAKFLGTGSGVGPKAGQAAACQKA